MQASASRGSLSYLPSFPIGLQLEVKTSYSLEMFILANLITENIFMILAIFYESF